MTDNFWKNKRVIVTGGAGFLGKSLVPKIEKLGAETFVPRSKDFDLRKEEGVKKLFKSFIPDIVIHAAVHGGGIGYMKKHQGRIFYDNITMSTLILEEARKHNIEKFVGIGTICSYPKYTAVPFKEEDLWKGYPEETNAPYGLAKKMMMIQTQAYNKEYGFNGIHLLFVNMYGPHDNFEPKTSHVVPALIRKFTDAVGNKKSEVVVWGTGEATREFLYVEDAADAIIASTEKYNKPDPVNIGSGVEIKIKDLVKLIAELTDYNGEITWDTSKPDGQPRRLLDITKAEKEFGFKARTELKEGLKKTISWYEDNYLKIS